MIRENHLWVLKKNQKNTIISFYRVENPTGFQKPKKPEEKNFFMTEEKTTINKRYT